MTNIRKFAATALATTLFAIGPALATDPNGSTHPTPPRDTVNPTSVAPPSMDTTRPTVGGIGEIDVPALLPIDPEIADQDRQIDLILLGATDLAYGHDVCYGMITCCNSAWVQGCDAEQFNNICSFYGGVVVIQTFSDGSLNYECHYS